MNGWIKLHRCITENELYFAERFTRGQAWIDLLLMAGHLPRRVLIKGNEINLGPGELCRSQLNLAERWQWNYKTVIKFLKMLEKLGMAVTRTNNITTIIRINNWELYQGDGEQKGEPVVSGTVTNKNDKNFKKYLNSSGKKYYSRKENNGIDQEPDPFSIKSRLSYRPDPEKSRARYEELKKLFG